VRGYSLARPGPLVIEARTEDGSRLRASSCRRLTGRAGTVRAKNIILLLGDGMGAAHRTAARIVSRGVQNGRRQGTSRWTRST
jgi:alkaline phosphatase